MLPSARMVSFLRLSLFCFCLHFLATFVGITMYQASFKSDIRSGMLEASETTQLFGAAVQLLRFPASVFARKNALLDQIPDLPVWLLLVNSAVWGMALTSWYFLYLDLRGGSREQLEESANAVSPPANVQLAGQFFWLTLVFFLATYTLHLLEMAELMARNLDSPVIPIARFFRLPLTPLVFPDSMWHSTDVLVTDRFWLILPNSLIWAFSVALVVRVIGKHK